MTGESQRKGTRRDRSPSHPFDLTPNTVATLALFLALGGSSYAALSVTGNVKNFSLTGKDVQNLSLIHI